MRVGLGGGQPNRAETAERQPRSQTVLRTTDERGQRGLIREIVFAAVALMAALVSDISNCQYGLRVQLTLDADAPLIAGRKFVIVYGQTSYVRGVNRAARGSTSSERYARVLQCDALEADVQAEGDIGAGIVHVIALDALIHDAKPATDNGFAAARKVISEPEARSEGCPVIIDQTLRNTVFLGNTDSVQVERNARENRIGTGTEPWAGRTDRPIWKHDGRVCWVVERRVEITHTVVRFISVGHAIPPQAEIEGQLAVYAPVILSVRGPRYVVPKAVILDCEFAITLGIAKEEIGEVISGESSVKAKRTLCLAEEILDFLIDRPATSEFELVSSLGYRDVVANLIVVSLVHPRPTGNFEVSAGRTVQVDIGDAVQVIGSRK